jgi:hypothetical protein
MLPAILIENKEKINTSLTHRRPPKALIGRREVAWGRNEPLGQLIGSPAARTAGAGEAGANDREVTATCIEWLWRGTQTAVPQCA